MPEVFYIMDFLYFYKHKYRNCLIQYIETGLVKKHHEEVVVFTAKFGGLFS